MAEETGVDLRLADVLQALTAELRRAADGSSGVRVDTVTVELDVAVDADADGEVSFRVGKGSGATKRGKTTRLSVTLGSPTGAQAGDRAPLPAQPEGAASPSEPVDAVAAPSPQEPRPLGLVDVLADALRTIADTAGRSGAPGWPPRPGDTRPGDSRPRGDRPGGGHPGLID